MAKKYFLRYTPDNPIGGGTNAHILTAKKTLVDTVNGETSVVSAAGPRFEVSETRRKLGLRPRGVWLARRDPAYGTQVARFFCPVLKKAKWNDIDLGDTFTIDGQTWTIVRKDAEEVGS